jgi:hypothetical protein
MAVCSRRPVVRVVSVLFALGVMLLYSLSRGKVNHGPLNSFDNRNTIESEAKNSEHGRHLLSYLASHGDSLHSQVEDGDDGSGGGGGGGDEDNCTFPGRDDHPGYNTSCEFVLDVCGDEAQLFDYLRFIVCDLPSGIKVNLSGCESCSPAPY